VGHAAAGGIQHPVLSRGSRGAGQLRGYDAVHLASALALGTYTTLVTWDEDLKRAAAHCGCAVARAR